MKKDDAVFIVKKIEEVAPDHHFEFREPFWVMINTMLSHRTKDEVTDNAGRALYEKYRDAKGLSKANYDDVLKIIDKVGFKTVKAARIIEAAKIIIEKFGGEVPKYREQLMEIPGIGRKTANVVLADGFGIPAIAVDTHVMRISIRTGLSKNKDPDMIEQDLMKLIPEDLWLQLNTRFVEFGKSVCRPVGPKCNECPVSFKCNYGRKHTGNKG
ncbi:endonuclease III domain-containing protein [Caldiplasma sukawensis]